MDEDRKIMLVFNPRAGFQHDVIEGVRQYLARMPNWTLKGIHQYHPDSVALVQRWRPDGIVGLIEQKSLAECIIKKRIPSVDIAGHLPAPPGAMVTINNFLVGKMAAEFFLKQGFRNFAFFGMSNATFSKERLRGFSETLAGAGAVCLTHFLSDPELTANSGPEWFGSNRKLTGWLKKLPRPVAVFCSHDQYGLLLLNACRELDVHVPLDVSVMGVDNNAIMCFLARPSLTSIRQPGTQIGFRATELLDEILQGKADGKRIITLDPAGISKRESTFERAIDDPDVSAALQLIYQNCIRYKSVGDILGGLIVSRRSLEMKFRRTFGYGIWGHVQRARVERAQKYIRETDMKMSVIARRVGLSNAAHLTTMFRRLKECTPIQYRRQYQYKVDTEE